MAGQIGLLDLLRHDVRVTTVYGTTYTGSLVALTPVKDKSLKDSRQEVKLLTLANAVADGEPGEPRRQLQQVSIYVSDVSNIHRIDRNPHYDVISSTSSYTTAPKLGYIPPVLPSAHLAAAQHEYHTPSRPRSQPLTGSAQDAKGYINTTAPVAMPTTISHRSQEQSLQNELFFTTAKPPTLGGYITNAESLVMGTTQQFQPYNIHSNVQFSVGPGGNFRQSGEMAAHSHFAEDKHIGSVETTDYDMHSRPQQSSDMPHPLKHQLEQHPQTEKNTSQTNSPAEALVQGTKSPHIGALAKSLTLTEAPGMPTTEPDYYRRYSSPAKLSKNKAVELGMVKEGLISDSSLREIAKCSLLPQYGGYDYPLFLPHADQEEFSCPICHLILREPYLTDCCGTHYCRSCIEPLWGKGSACPLCCKATFSVMVNRKIQRQILELKTRCPQFEKGCQWIGSISEAEQHTDPSNGNCDFICIPCPLGCTEMISLSDLDEHKKNVCKRRLFMCKFCEFQGVYENIPHTHWPVCQGYPIPCPNKCLTADFPRRELSQHLLVCPHRQIECEFKFAGCHESFPFNEKMLHMSNHAQTHVLLLAFVVQKLMSDKQPSLSSGQEKEKLRFTMTEKKEEVDSVKAELEAKNEELVQLTSKLEVVQDEVEELRNDLVLMKTYFFRPPFEFTLKNFSQLKASSEQWFSSPFYTHKQGYKMCISVDCAGSDEGNGSHVSVYANLMKGEFDDDLSWPFLGTVVIRLLNHRMDSNHCEHEIPFTRDSPPEIADRVSNQDIAESGLGIPKFIHHHKLAYDPRENLQYLLADSLHFCVVSVKVH